MKRSVFILFAGGICILLLFLFRPKQPVANKQAETPQSTEANVEPALAAENLPTNAFAQTSSSQVVTITKPKEPLDVLKAQNLSDWINAIPNIKLWSHFRTRSSWIAAPMNTNNYAALLLTGINGNTIQFTASLTDVEAMGDYVRRVELHSPDMNIDEAREFGDSLLGIMGKDKSGFDAWCDKVGNNWIDAPLYSSGSAQVPNSNKFYGLQTLRSYGNERPWVVYFIITDK